MYFVSQTMARGAETKDVRQWQKRNDVLGQRIVYVVKSHLLGLRACAHLHRKSLCGMYLWSLPAYQTRSKTKKGPAGLAAEFLKSLNPKP